MSACHIHYQRIVLLYHGNSPIHIYHVRMCLLVVPENEFLDDEAVLVELVVPLMIVIKSSGMLDNICTELERGKISETWQYH